jgi:hypothetical protein
MTLMSPEPVAAWLAGLLADPPALHIGEDGAPISFGVAGNVLAFIDRNVRPGMPTAETGAGLSTIVFAAGGARHTAITNKGDEAERITDYCAAHGVDTAGIRFVVGDSADALPGASLSDLELVLIDGRHAFPSPFLDWYTQLWTAGILRDFLLEQPGWTVEADLPPRSACFRLTDPIDHVNEWPSQPFVVRQSNRVAQAAPLPEQTAAAPPRRADAAVPAAARKVGRGWPFQRKPRGR